MKDRLLQAAVLTTPSLFLGAAAVLVNSRLYVPAVAMAVLAAVLFVASAFHD